MIIRINQINRSIWEFLGEVKDRIVMFDESKKKCIPSKMEEKSDSNDMESDDPAGLHKLWVG